MEAFDFRSRPRVIFGEGSLRRIGAIACELGFHRTLLVSDAGIRAAGHVDAAVGSLAEAGIEAFPFYDFSANPTSDMVERGRAFCAPLGIDSIIGLGGGSSMDCAKAINFVLSNGGRMEDYQGYGKASRPMLPMIAVPTTAGTGSEAQTYALISKPGTHEKMACGDEKAGFRTAILDPSLLLSQPAGVRATAGFDAISHATETWVTKGRNAISDCFAREAWRLLEPNYERMLAYPDDLESLGAMQVGAHLAGLAIENSMLGATHACANPLTARYGTEHGVAIAVLLPAVVKWNGAAAGARYAELLALCAHQRAGGDATDALALRLEQLARAGGLPASLAEIGVPHEDLTTLAGLAALQWTGRFNPRPLDAAAALEIYECAY